MFCNEKYNFNDASIASAKFNYSVLLLSFIIFFDFKCKKVENN